MDKRATAAEKPGETSNTARYNLNVQTVNDSVSYGAGKGQMSAQQQREDCWEQDAKWDSPERSKQGESFQGETTGTHAQAPGRGKGRVATTST